MRNEITIQYITLGDITKKYLSIPFFIIVIEKSSLILDISPKARLYSGSFFGRSRIPDGNSILKY